MFHFEIELYVKTNYFLGIYLVMASYVTHQNQATVSIVNNRQPIMSLAFTQTTRTGLLDEDLSTSASNIVIVKCLAKEKLLVKKIAGPNKCKSHHKARMMFSAILLHRDGESYFFFTSVLISINFIIQYFLCVELVLRYMVVFIDYGLSV